MLHSVLGQAVGRVVGLVIDQASGQSLRDVSEKFMQRVPTILAL
jgi:hypothetical protein